MPPSLRSSRALSVALLLALPVAARAQATTVVSGSRPARLVIRNAMVEDGNGTPAAGPKDIVVERGKIVAVVDVDPVSLRGGVRRPEPGPGGAVIDATGKYVLPGLIDVHAHLQDERGGEPQPFEYELELWLACGITTVRDVSSDTRKAMALRDSSARGLIAAPRIFIYPAFGRPTNPDSARARVRQLKAMGADGIKFFGIDRDIMQAAEDEAHQLGMRIAHHAGVEETNAWDDIRFGTTSIEHWYGIPDAAIPDGVQDFPASYNYDNEADRFRWAGHLWREADPKRLDSVLTAMVQAHVAWVPTLDIYEASRDLQRAQNQPWFRDYLHPALEDYFKPDLSNHGSYFVGWTSTDETFWKENYRIWERALREFARKGGIIGSGDDAGFIYQMYGFGLIRELELEQEAGFHPIKIIQHVTGNNALILGQEQHLGRIRAGYDADLIVVNGNPLANLKVLYPTGVDEVRDGKVVHTGGVEWTIKDGIVYSAPRMLADVKEIVRKARAEREKAQ